MEGAGAIESQDRATNSRVKVLQDLTCPNGLDAYSQGIPFDCGYTWLLDLAKKAQEVGVIKGILFHQGETNNTDPNWKYTVQQIVQDLKTDLRLDDIPFLAGELLYEQYNSCCSAHNIEINKLIPTELIVLFQAIPTSAQLPVGLPIQ
jgi:hypothetical protein